MWYIKRVAILALTVVTLWACGQGASSPTPPASSTTPIPLTATLQGTVMTSGGLSKGSQAPTGSPAAGATVLIYDLDQSSTTAVATTTTDAQGHWTAAVPLSEQGQGKFAVFAVVSAPSGGEGKVQVARQEDITVTQPAATVTVPALTAEIGRAHV